LVIIIDFLLLISKNKKSVTSLLSDCYAFVETQRVELWSEHGTCRAFYMFIRS